MSLSPLPWTDFGGLDLRREADESGCPDLLNVVLDKPTSVRTRNGTRLFATPPGSPTSVERMRPFYRASGDQLLTHFRVSGGSNVAAFDSAGGVVATQAMASATSVCDFASLGTPSAERAYVCDSAGPLFRWNGAAFTSIPGSPRCSYIAPTSDSRLCAANVSALPSGSGASSASSSLALFSDPGDPETYGANNFEYLTPGDGDAITGVVSWQNLIFIFKRTKFFVLLTPSQDSAGQPLFDYRTVDTRVSSQAPFSAVAAPEGVYFASGDGIYLTTGFSPRKVSTVLDPFFTGETSPLWNGLSIGTDVWGAGVDQTDTWGDGTGTDTWGSGGIVDVRLAYVNDKLYCFCYGHSGMFMLDVATSKVTYWEFPLVNYSLAPMQLGTSGPEVLLLGQTTKIVKMDRTVMTDDGQGIVSHWRSPYFNPTKIPDQEATIHESILHGTGVVGHSVARDWATGLPTSAGGAKTAVKLGVDPAVAQGRHRKSQRGRSMSFQIETPTASDDFSSNTIANYTADAGATTNVSITGGVMNAAANFTTQNDLILTTGTFTDFGDCVSTVKINVGVTRTNFLAGRLLKRVAASSRLAIYVQDNGSTSTLNIANPSAVRTFSTLTRISASTSYWLRVTVQGNVVTAEWFTADPSTTTAATTLSYTLTGSDATTYGSGIVGKTGFVFQPQETTASLDDSSVIGGAWKVEDLTMQVTGIRAPALQTA